MNNEEENKIIQQLKQGDDRGYRYLFNVHYEPLCHVAFGFLKDRFLAESVVGDVIFRLWEKREELDIKISLRAYLVRAVRNSSINYLNQEYVLKESYGDLTDEMVNAKSTLKFSNQYPLATLIEKELESELAKAIDELPKETKIVFQLSRFEGMKYAEIAEKLGISVNTVKYHIKSALSILTSRFRKYLIFNILTFISSFF